MNRRTFLVNATPPDGDSTPEGLREGEMVMVAISRLAKDPHDAQAAAVVASYLKVRQLTSE